MDTDYNTIKNRKKSPCVHTDTTTILKGKWEGNFSRRMVPNKERRGERTRTCPLHDHQSSHQCRQRASADAKTFHMLGSRISRAPRIPRRLSLMIKGKMMLYNGGIWGSFIRDETLHHQWWDRASSYAFSMKGWEGHNIAHFFFSCKKHSTWIKSGGNHQTNPAERQSVKQLRHFKTVNIGKDWKRL